MRGRLLVVLMGAGLVLGACASTGGSGSSGSRDVIAQEQIDNYDGHSLYLLVQALRPMWLHTRGTGSMQLSEAVRVYVDGVPRGTVATLENIHPRDVAEVRYHSARDATMRFGTGHSNGAILVELK